MKIIAGGPGSKDCKIFLDGKEVTRDCYEADDEEGYVKCYKRNDFGDFYIDRHNPDESARETRQGKVEIIKGGK